MPITMVKETKKSIFTKILTEDDIQTISYNKKQNISQYKFECLLEYSCSVIGYSRSLLLEGYQERK